MLEFAGSKYYFDLKALDKFITVTNADKEPRWETETKETFDKDNILISKEVFGRKILIDKVNDMEKYDLIKMFIEIIVDFDADGDGAMGSERAFADTPLGYKFVFNTLVKEGIIKEKD